MKKIIRFHLLSLPAGLFSFLLIITGGIFVVMNGGFEFSIDFDAGLNIQTRVSGATVGSVQDALQEIERVSVRSLGDQGEFVIRLRLDENTEVSTFQRESETRILSLLDNNFSSVEILESAYIGPRFSQSLRVQTFILIGATMLLILLYLWFRFQIQYALASIVALVHDMVILLVFFGISRLEISSATAAAALTILGYSLNDTIIIFDRIRENRTLLKDHKLVQIVDVSITQSLARTIITSLTTLLAVVAIAIYAKDTIRYFAISLIVGILVGTYSSIFIASPVLLGLMHKKQKKELSADSHSTEQDTGIAQLPSEETSVKQDQQSRTGVNVEALKREIGFKSDSRHKKKRNLH